MIFKVALTEPMELSFMKVQSLSRMVFIYIPHKSVREVDLVNVLGDGPL